MDKQKAPDYTLDDWNEAKISYLQVLLQRPPVEEYINQWASALMKQKKSEILATESTLVLFRLSKEWLALPANIFKEVLHPRKIHWLPHRSSKLLLGVINLEGELRLCISLHALLDIHVSNKTGPQATYNLYTYERMIAMQKEHEVWVFPVDEVAGIYCCDLAFMENVPVTLSKSTANYLKGVIHVPNKNVGLLDPDLLFYGLKKEIL